MIENRGFQYVLYFTALVVIGSTGFYIIGGKSWSVIDSIYMTIITISTVGFSEVHTLSQVGKIWTIIVIIFGVGGFASIIYEFEFDYRGLIRGNPISIFFKYLYTLVIFIPVYIEIYFGSFLTFLLT